MSASRSKVVGQVFDVGVDILCTTLDASTGVLSAQTGDSTTQTPDADRSEWWQHTGFTSRPAVPSQGNASCQGIVLKQNDRDQIIATRDVRGTAILGNLADGETCVYAAGSQARTVYKADGSITSITTDDNTSKGNAVFSRVDPTGFSSFSSNASIKGDAMGLRLSTWQGARFTMSGLGLPAPFDALGLKSLVSIKADVITLDAAVLNLGRVGGTGSAQALVQATPLAAVMALLTTVLNDVQTYLIATAAVPAVVGTAPIATPAVLTAQNALSTALTAANAKLATIANPTATGGTATNSTMA